MYQLVKPTVDWPAMLQYYRWAKGHPADAPLPDVARVVEAAEQPHVREGLGA